MKTTKWVMGLLMGLPLVGAAGDRAGNGGDVVICPGKPVRMLDAVEAADRGYRLDLSGATTLSGKLDIAFKRMRRLDPIRAQKIEEGAQMLLKDVVSYLGKTDLHSEISVNEENTWFTNRELEDIPDSRQTALEAGCSIKQLVIQLFPGEWSVQTKKKYTIQKDLLLQMDLDQVAAMILHESWYSYTSTVQGIFETKGPSIFGKNKETKYWHYTFENVALTDSRIARILNGYFLSSDSQNDSVFRYAEFLRSDYELSWYGTRGFLPYRLPIAHHGVADFLLRSDVAKDGFYEFKSDYFLCEVDSEDCKKNLVTAGLPLSTNQVTFIPASGSVNAVSARITKVKVPQDEARAIAIEGYVNLNERTFSGMRANRIYFKNAVAKSCHRFGAFISSHCFWRRDARKGIPIEVLFDDEGYIREFKQNGKEGMIASIEWKGRKIKDPSRIVIDHEGNVTAVE